MSTRIEHSIQEAKTDQSKSRRPLRKFTRTEWTVLAGLFLLTAIPVIAGIARIYSLISGVALTGDDSRFFDAPLPVVIHIAGMIPYSILGTLQFIPALRRWKPHWHKALGLWLLFPSGLMVALSGIWMTVFYAMPAYDGMILYWIRLAVGSAMAVFLVLGYFSARQYAYKQHGMWMIRAYALAMGAGTQVITHIPWMVFQNSPIDETGRAIAMASGWVINIILAEWIIHRYLKRPRNKTIPKHAI